MLLLFFTWAANRIDHSVILVGHDALHVYLDMRIELNIVFCCCHSASLQRIIVTAGGLQASSVLSKTHCLRGCIVCGNLYTLQRRSAR